MLDYGSGFFLGLKLGFILIILGIEFYFLVFAKIIDKEANVTENTIYIILFVISIVLVVLKMSLISIIIPPSGFVFIYFLQKKKEEIITKQMEEKRIKELKEIISQQPNNFKAYIELGDLYFKREDYEEALKLYRTGYKLKDFPWIKQKVEITEREVKIKKGIIWVCRNCQEDNPGESDICKNCGEEKEVLKSIKKDLKQTKKYFILILISPLLVSLVLAIFIYMPLYLSIFIFLLLLYLVFKFFLTY